MQLDLFHFINAALLFLKQRKHSYNLKKKKRGKQKSGAAAEMAIGLPVKWPAYHSYG